MKDRLCQASNGLRNLWRRHPLPCALVAVAVLAVAATLAAPRLRQWGAVAERFAFTGRTSSGPQLPGALNASRRPGLVNLDDFQIVVPPGWQRRKDWEDEGPGTKLFLLGPKITGGQMVVGIDVYPLRSGTTLDTFTKQYSARWNQALLTSKPATLCDKPGRLLTIAENGLDKVYLLSVWRSKGLAIGMIAPAGQMAAATPSFRLVVDTFQLYQ
jgi:hypothetical protein